MISVIFLVAFSFLGDWCCGCGVEGEGRCSCDDVNIGLQAGLEGHGGDA